MHAYIDGEGVVFVAQNGNRGNTREELTEAEYVETALLLHSQGQPPEGQAFDRGIKDWRGEAAQQIPDALQVAATAVHAVVDHIREELSRPSDAWHQRAAYAIVHPIAAMRYARFRRQAIDALERDLLRDEMYYSSLASAAFELEQGLSVPQDETGEQS